MSMTPPSGSGGNLPRRALLAGGVLGGGALIGTWLAASRGSPPPANEAQKLLGGAALAWRDNTPKPLYIAHRGVGDVVPEHTLEGYLTALEQGAKCLELSIGLTSDGVMVCMHDLTLDRTTTLKGPVAGQSARALHDARVSVPRLGPRWTGPGMPPIPLLTDVLERLGRRAILAVEAKDDEAFEPMLALIRRNGLTDQIMVKVFMHSTGRRRQAKAQGFPLFAYAGSATDLEPAVLNPVVAELDPRRDVLVIPAAGDKGPTPEPLVRRAVATGVPVWAYPVHRRSEAAALVALGVSGLVTPCIGYLTGQGAVATGDSWSSSAISSGELTRFPYSDRFALKWTDGDALLLDVAGEMSFVMPGHMCPIAGAKESYRIELDVRFDPLPTDARTGFSLAFGREDDSYYQHRIGTGNGYHALLRADGEMALFAHRAGTQEGTPLGEPVRTPALTPGTWTRVRLDVTPTTMRWSRDGGSAVLARDSSNRGGYFHLGRTGFDGPVSLRRLRVSRLNG